jgi:hypothetical protein
VGRATRGCLQPEMSMKGLEQMAKKATKKKTTKKATKKRKR